MDRKTILAVYNNRDDLKAIGSLLRANGYDMLIAYDGISGVALARRERPSMLIVDIDVPAGGGTRLLDRLNSFLPTQTKTIVIVNGKPLQGMEKAMGDGTMFVVHKPVNPEELLCCVKKVLTKEECQWADISLEDSLTGLFTLGAFKLLADQQIRVADRAKRQMVMLRMKVNNARQLDRYHGPGSSDKVMIEMAKVLTGTFRNSDIKARIEEYELAVLALETGEGGDELIVERLQSSLNRLNDRKLLPFRLWASITTKTYDPGKPCTLSDLLSGAEKSFAPCPQPRGHGEAPPLWTKTLSMCMSTSAN